MEGSAGDRPGRGSGPLNKTFETCARAAHEVNRAFSLHHGDDSHLPWSASPDWVRESALAGVEAVVLRKESPEELHRSWSQKKLADGWVYGPEKDPVKKTHPCLVPYNSLSPADREKDKLFFVTVWAVYHALTGGIS